jgi:hypothetical protein
MKKTLLLLFGLTCFTLSFVKGQNTRLYTGNYQQILFVDLINQLESTTDLKFYFSPDLDSITHLPSRVPAPPEQRQMPVPGELLIFQ